MKSQIASEMDHIRNSWSDAEREDRRNLAGAMLLQLRQVVVLSELAAANHESNKQPIEMASAC